MFVIEPHGVQVTPGEGADNEVVSRGKSDADKTDGRKEYSWAMHIEDVYNLSHSIMKKIILGAIRLIIGVK